MKTYKLYAADYTTSATMQSVLEYILRILLCSFISYVLMPPIPIENNEQEWKVFLILGGLNLIFIILIIVSCIEIIKRVYIWYRIKYKGLSQKHFQEPELIITPEKFYFYNQELNSAYPPVFWADILQHQFFLIHGRGEALFYVEILIHQDSRSATSMQTIRSWIERKLRNCELKATANQKIRTIYLSNFDFTQYETVKRIFADMIQAKDDLAREAIVERLNNYG
ncbi:hypothetical protein MIS46_10240 [Wielerella bovis]|uniref:hypothetical protein n=1 Tax=Wielerella bovis TaxID=2917790 RepID=UPI002019B89A|nr:hypothetical protein [Wielerella bovis]ULJ62320.1 hypothetical protein MIS46_10240 [Wielerella bovis]